MTCFYVFWTLFVGDMNARVGSLFGEIFYLVYGFEYESCLSELADATGQLKTTCATLENAAAFGILLSWTSVPKVFYHVLLEFALLAHLFSTFQTALQTL